MRIFRHKNFPLGFLTLSLLSYYIFVGFIAIDPDFGWHLKFGEVIKNTHTIPKLDLFSYSMSSYLFVDHEWLSDLAIAFLFPAFGKLFLSIVFGLVAIASFLLQIKILPQKWFIAPFLLAGMSIFPFVGIRPQLISLLFFSILLVILFSKNYLRYVYFLPFLFLLWGNLHGGFFLGIGMFGIYIFAKALRKKILKKDLGIFLISFLVTLINPYGIYLWKEIFTTALDPNLRVSIGEWMSPLFSPNLVNLPFFISLSLSFFLLTRYFKKFGLAEKTIYLVLFLFSLTSVRNVGFFSLISLLITVKGFNFLFYEASKYQLGEIRFNKLYKVFLCLLITVFILIFLNALYVFRGYDESVSYPKEAAVFLKTQLSKGQIFSTYNWGGYLIWKLPENKVFIDGRMPSWKRDSSPKNESKNALLEYYDILFLRLSLKSEISKYNIDTFLLPLPANKPKPNSKLYNFLTEPVFGKRPYDSNLFIKELQKNDFILVYEDSTSQIYKRF